MLEGLLHFLWGLVVLGSFVGLSLLWYGCTIFAASLARTFSNILCISMTPWWVLCFCLFLGGMISLGRLAFLTIADFFATYKSGIDYFEPTSPVLIASGVVVGIAMTLFLGLISDDERQRKQEHIMSKTTQAPKRVATFKRSIPRLTRDESSSEHESVVRIDPSIRAEPTVISQSASLLVDDQAAIKTIKRIRESKTPFGQFLLAVRHSMTQLSVGIVLRSEARAYREAEITIGDRQSLETTARQYGDQLARESLERKRNESDQSGHDLKIAENKSQSSKYAADIAENELRKARAKHKKDHIKQYLDEGDGFSEVSTSRAEERQLSAAKDRARRDTHYKVYMTAGENLRTLVELQSWYREEKWQIHNNGALSSDDRLDQLNLLEADFNHMKQKITEDVPVYEDI